ncbi:putative reverse transcriptase domain-containing protein [Tanacetum coccineum]
MKFRRWRLTCDIDRERNDLAAYTQRFQELILLCTRIVPDEEDRVERFIGGLPDQHSGKCDCSRIQLDSKMPYDVTNWMDKKAQESLTPGRAIDRSVVGTQHAKEPHLGNQQGVIFAIEWGEDRDMWTRRISNVKAYVIGGGGTNPDSNVVTGTFLLNNCYASMLFDSGADRSFVSSTFSVLLDVGPSTLDISYVIELADGRIS